MRKLLTSIIACILISATAFSQKENIIKMSPAVNDVIVYLTGAQIRYKVNVNLVQGRNMLILSELAPKLDPTSIRITADENSAVLSISPKITTELVDAEQAKYIRVNDSIKLITNKLEAINDEKNALGIQKTLLLSSPAA